MGRLQGLRLPPALLAFAIAVGLTATFAAGSNTTGAPGANVSSTPPPLAPTMPPATTTAFPTSTAVAPTTAAAQMPATTTAAPVTSNASSVPVYTPSPTDGGFVVGVRLFTVSYRVAGDRFAAALAQAYSSLRAAVQVDMAGNLGTMTQLVVVRRLDIGSLLIEADVHADGGAAASSPADQRSALDARYLMTAHDFASVRAVYVAVNGDTGEPLRTVSINMTNRDDSLGVPPASPGGTPPPPPTEAEFGIEACGFACGVFVAAVVVFACAIGGVVAYLVCCRRTPKPQPAGLHSLKKPATQTATATSSAAP